MFNALTAFYGKHGPNENNKNFQMYKMIPESLRVSRGLKFSKKNIKIRVVF